MTINGILKETIENIKYRRRMKRIDLLKIFTESKKAKGEKMNLYRKKMKVMQRVSLESLELIQKLSNYTKL